MKQLILSFMAFVMAVAAQAQTLNVTMGSVTYLFPASQTGDMTYQNGETLTIMGKTFTISDISSMTVNSSFLQKKQRSAPLSA